MGSATPWPAPKRVALERALLQHMAAALPKAQQPDRVHLVADIPRSFLNKMLRREVRALLTATPPPWATAPDKVAA
jgi:fatty-acyl-CoA synthase